MDRLLISLIMIIIIESCNRETQFFVDDSDEEKIALINIDKVYKTVTEDSIIVKIGFKNIPDTSIPFEYLNVEIVFDVNNDTIYENDLSLEFLSFKPDSIDKPINLSIQEIFEIAPIKAVYKYSAVIQSETTYTIQKETYCTINEIYYSGNYLIFRLSKNSSNILANITDSLNWQVQTRYGDGLADRINDDRYIDFFSPYYNLKDRNK